MSAVRRAALFLLICSPLWLAPGAVWQGYPFTLPALVGLTLYSCASTDVLVPQLAGLSSLRAGELVGGLGGPRCCWGHRIGHRARAAVPWLRNPRFDPTVALFSFLSLLYGNAVEELIFRGYSFERLIAGIGHWKAHNSRRPSSSPCSTSQAGGPGRPPFLVRRSGRCSSGSVAYAGKRTGCCRSLTRRPIGRAISFCWTLQDRPRSSVPSRRDHGHPLSS